MKSIILRDWEVRGILEGRISQLRRPAPQPPGEGYQISRLMESTSSKDRKHEGKLHWIKYHAFEVEEHDNKYFACPFGQIGDMIFGKETFAFCEAAKLCTPKEISEECQEHWKSIGYIWYRADGEQTNEGKTAGEHLNGRGNWRSSFYMPQWASRIILQTDEIWVERVQEISEEDARANGIIDGGCLNCGNHEPCGCSNPQPDARDAFAYLWNNDYSKQGFDWIINPYVFAAKVRRVEG